MSHSNATDPVGAVRWSAAVRVDPVLAAAADVIMTHGPRRATLAEVARQAGVSRMTVYRRFESFDRLVSELLTAELADLLNSRGPVAAGSARGRAVAVVAHLTSGIAQHPLLDRVLHVDPEAMVPLMVSRYGETQRVAMRLLGPLLAEGMAARGGDGSIRSADPEVLAQTVVTAAQAFVFGAQAIAGTGRSDELGQEWRRMVAAYLAPDHPQRG